MKKKEIIRQIQLIEAYENSIKSALLFAVISYLINYSKRKLAAIEFQSIMLKWTKKIYSQK